MTRKRKIIIGGIAVALLLLGGGVATFALRGETPPETATASKVTIVDDIDFTGTLQAAHVAELGFESSGAITTVAVTEGSVVTPGQILATQDTSIASLELARARADRLGSLAVAETALVNAQSAAQASAAVNARMVESARQTVRNAKNEYDQAKVVWAATARESGDAAITEVRYAAVQTALSAYRSAQAALKEAEKSALKTTDAALAAVADAQVGVQNIRQTSPTIAGLSALATSEQLASLRVAKQILRAPFAGVVTDVAMTAGELATAGSTAITIQTTDDLKIVAQVPETDVALLAVGQSAKVAFDAFPDASGDGRITAIAPAAVLVEGVPTYDVTLRLNQVDGRHKPGLSTTITVRVNEKPNVVAIPRRAVTTAHGQKRVRVVVSENVIEDRAVTTGIQGSDGMIEIIEGLREGEVVVVRQP